MWNPGGEKVEEDLFFSKIKKIKKNMIFRINVIIYSVSIV